MPRHRLAGRIRERGGVGTRREERETWRRTERWAAHGVGSNRGWDHGTNRADHFDRSGALRRHGRGWSPGHAAPACRLVQRGGRHVQHGPLAYLRRTRTGVSARLARLETTPIGTLLAHSDVRNYRHLQGGLLRLCRLPNRFGSHIDVAGHSRVRGWGL